MADRVSIDANFLASVIGVLEQCPVTTDMDWIARRNDLIVRARTVLSRSVSEGSAKNCWLDDEPDICPSPCVFEDPDEVIDNCVYASVLNSQGKCKTDCKYYRQPHKCEGNYEG